MDKTSSFILGVMAGAVGLGFASYVIAEYLPAKRKEAELLRSTDAAEADDADEEVSSESEEETVAESEAVSTGNS